MRLIVLLFLFLSPLVLRGQAADSVEVEKKKYLDILRKQIAGKEARPASEVFRNIKLFGQSTAGRLLSVMDVGFSRSLGVRCSHCHVPGEWESESKPTKQIARDMSAMVSTVNRDLLKNIRNLRTSSPIVNCTTCHRGQTQPALSLPEH